MLELIAAAALALAPAETLSRLPAPEANQGVAVDQAFIYAIDNSTIAKYDRATGQRVAISTGPAHHMNSGFLFEGKLLCAHSNFPQKPEQSQIMALDPATMVPSASCKGLFLMGPRMPSGRRRGVLHVRPSSADVITMPHHSRGLGPTL